MQHNIPSQFKAAVFPQPGAEHLEIRNLNISEVEPRQHEVLIRVHACALNSTDEVIRNDLVPHLGRTLRPGMSIYGTVVKIGQQNGSNNVKVGEKVAAVVYSGGCAEYARVHSDCLVQIKSNEFQGRESETAVYAFDASRVLSTWRRCEKEQQALGEHERRMIEEHNRLLGFDGSPVCVIYGEGGYARLAIELLEKACQQSQSPIWGGKKHRIVLVASSTKWSAKDYGINDRDLLCVEKDDVERELKKMGGAGAILCVDQPDRGFEHLLEGTRYGASITLLNPSQQQNLTLPLAQIIAKALRVQGPPILTRECLEHCLSFVQKHNIRAEVKKYRFEQNELNSAWKSLEQGRSFDAPLIVME